MNNPYMFFAFLILVIGITIYLVPTIVARSRKHANATSITVLNVLLGWSIVGWVVALVWAYSAQAEASPSDVKAARSPRRCLHEESSKTQKLPLLRRRSARRSHQMQALCE
jgi:hypothetical protein